MKTVLITGATSGIGKTTALALAQKGYHLILINRNAEKTKLLTKELQKAGAHKVDSYQADLSMMQDVKRVAQEVLANHVSIDVLLNNAGLIAGNRTTTKEGLELTFATNHMAPFLLTGLLLPLVSKGKTQRVVNVASAAHKWAKIDLNDLNMENNYKALPCYCNSKLMNILHAKKMASKPELNPIQFFSLHPGAVSTGFGTTSTSVLKWMVNLFRPLMLSAEKGALTSIALCSLDQMDAENGSYFEKERPKKPEPAALDTELRDGLWEKSMDTLQLLGIPTESLYKLA